MTLYGKFGTAFDEKKSSVKHENYELSPKKPDLFLGKTAILSIDYVGDSYEQEVNKF